MLIHLFGEGFPLLLALRQPSFLFHKNIDMHIYYIERDTIDLMLALPLVVSYDN